MFDVTMDAESLSIARKTMMGVHMLSLSCLEHGMGSNLGLYTLPLVAKSGQIGGKCKLLDKQIYHQV